MTVHIMITRGRRQGGPRVDTRPGTRTDTRDGRRADAARIDGDVLLASPSFNWGRS